MGGAGLTPGRVVVIAGPTATGKSDLAARLARALGGAVVNADALQVYADLKILSARPEEDAASDPPHLLYGVLGAGDRASAGWWARAAADVIRSLWAADRPAILVGGSGLYLRALLEGLSPMPVVDRTWTEAGRARLEALGLDAFVEEIRLIDPEAAAAVAPGDRQRLIRIWSVFQATGETLSDWRARPPEPPLTFTRVDAFVVEADRAVLHRRCEARFDAMMAAGALEEARRLQALDPPADAPVRKAVGAAPLLAHLAGELSLEAAVERAKRDTRRYAKRQDTWLRGQTPHWPRIETGRPETFGDVLGVIRSAPSPLP